MSESDNPKLTSSLLYLDGVSVSFDGYKALRGLSLALAPGEMRAIIGPNGAGKTTMMDVVTGKTRPDEGDVYFEGRHDLTRLDEAEIAELGVGRKFQKPTVFENHTRIRQHPARRQGAALGVRDAIRRRRPTRARDDRTHPGDDPPRAISASGSPARCRTARSNGWRSACCSPRTPSSCWSTNPSPA